MATVPAAIPEGGKRERNKAENRAAILDAAGRVFAELGYDGATIRDVIRGTALASGTFYNYFPDKESLLRALFDDSMRKLHRRAQEGRAAARTLADVVRSTFRDVFTFLAEDRAAFELMHRNAGAIRAILDEPAFVANRDDLYADIRRAIADGELAGIDATYLTAAINGVAFEVAACMVERQPVDVAGATAFATDLVLGGIATVARNAGGRRRFVRSSAGRAPGRTTQKRGGHPK
jgi:AcrR family transcriptional regulator